MIKGISAVDAIYGSTKKHVKKAVNKTVEAVKDNRNNIISTAALAGGGALSRYPAHLSA